MSIIGHETLTYSRARDQLAYAHGLPGTARRNRRFIVPWPTSSSLSSPPRVARLSFSRQQWLAITINKAKMFPVFVSSRVWSVSFFLSMINFFFFSFWLVLSIDYKSVKELSVTVLHDKGDRGYRLVNISDFMAGIKSFRSIGSNKCVDLMQYMSYLVFSSSYD